MKINDVLSGGLIGAFAAAVFLHARTFPGMPGQNVGPNLFPQLIAAGLLICAILLVIRGVKATGKQGLVDMPEWVGANRTTVGFLMIPFALVLYAIVSEMLGFIATAILFLLPLFLIFGVKPRTAAVVSVLSALVIHAMFYKLLKVPLPWGVLSPIAW